MGEYNATTGAAINPSLITGLNVPAGLRYRATPILQSLVAGDIMDRPPLRGE